MEHLARSGRQPRILLDGTLLYMRFFFSNSNFKVESPKALLLQTNHRFVTMIYFTLVELKTYKLAHLILNKEKKKIPQILILLKFIFLKAFKLGITKKPTVMVCWGCYTAFFLYGLFFFQFQVLFFYLVSIVKIFSVAGCSDLGSSV